MISILIGVLISTGGQMPIPQVHEYSWGADSYDVACDIVSTLENDGYIVCGFTWDPDVTPWSPDVYVIRIDNSGNLVWENRYFTSGVSLAYGICKSHDGTDRYCVVGETTGITGDQVQMRMFIDGYGNEYSGCIGFDGRLNDVVSTSDGYYYATGTNGNGSALIRSFDYSRDKWVEDSWPTQSQFNIGYDIDCIPSASRVTAAGYGWGTSGADRAGWFKRFSVTGGVTGPLHEEDIQAQLFSATEYLSSVNVAGRALGTNTAYLAKYTFKNWQYHLAYEYEYEIVSNQSATLGDIDLMSTAGPNYIVGYGHTGTAHNGSDMFIAWFNQDTGEKLMAVTGGGPDDQTWDNWSYGSLGGDYIYNENWAVASTSHSTNNWNVAVMIMPWFDISNTLSTEALAHAESSLHESNEQIDIASQNGSSAVIIRTEERGNAEISIYDFMGRRVGNSNSITINQDHTWYDLGDCCTATIPAGLYVVHIEINGYSTAAKVLQGV